MSRDYLPEGNPDLEALLETSEKDHEDSNGASLHSFPPHQKSNASPGIGSNEPGQDLETILAQLSQYSAAQQQSRQSGNNADEFRQLQQLQDLQIQHRQTPPASITESGGIQRSLDPRLNRDQTLTPSAQGSKTPIIDPATILEWPLALRCVNKLSAQNPNMAAVVKGVCLKCTMAWSVH